MQVQTVLVLDRRTHTRLAEPRLLPPSRLDLLFPRDLKVPPRSAWQEEQDAGRERQVTADQTWVETTAGMLTDASEGTRVRARTSWI
jgi:hypothetical protein